MIDKINKQMEDEKHNQEVDKQCHICMVEFPAN